MIASEKFKRLEALVSGAAKSLKDARSENVKLSKINRALNDENSNLKEELQRFSAYPLKHKRIKERLGKILHKLDKIAG